MLEKIYIKNFAIIEELNIDFKDHLTVITGETGAGKSIILGALGLILGDRADTSVLIDKDQKCIIEAIFNVHDNKSVHQYLYNNDFDSANNLTIRREISASGKSRAFINDTPATINALQEIGTHLVDLNRQFDSQLLNNTHFQYAVVDAFSDNKSIINDYRQALSIYQKSLKTLEEWKANEQKLKSELEYTQFIFNELDEASFVENEIEDAEVFVKSVEHQEEVSRSLQLAHHILADNENDIISSLKKAMQELTGVAKYHPSLDALVERLNVTFEELKDINAEVTYVQDNLQFNEEELFEKRNRLDIGYRLLKKHNVSTTSDLIALKNSLEEQLHTVNNLDEHIAALTLQIAEEKEKVQKYADQLWDNRIAIHEQLENNITDILFKIGMPNARIKVDLQRTGDFNTMGQDKLEFLIDSNMSDRFLPIAKAASGGEMSRVLLSIKSVIANQLALPTMIFDEVDSAISGEAAKQVAVLMKQMSEKQQIIVLTHQAQMAAMGDQHYFIYKKATEDSGRIATHVSILDNENRVNKIAQMIDGLHPSQAAINSVKEMLLNSQELKQSRMF